MSIKDLTEYCMDMIKLYPKLKDEIEDLYVLALDEIEAGESQHNECELAFCSIKQLIQNL
jgi:uncharacterized UPF0160 family protein